MEFLYCIAKTLKLVIRSCCVADMFFCLLILQEFAMLLSKYNTCFTSYITFVVFAVLYRVIDDMFRYYIFM